MGTALVLAGFGGATPSQTRQVQNSSLTAILGSVVPDVAQGQNYIPVTEGWDAQSGIDVTNQAANGALAAISALQAGQGDVSPSLADNIPVAVNNGGGVISIAQVAYSPSFSIVFPAGSKYQTVSASLKGATIGIQNLTSASYTLARGIVASVGLNPDSDVKYASIGQTTQAAQAVAANQVDVAIFTTAQLAYLDQAGVKYKYVRVPGLSRNYVGQQVATSTADLANPAKRQAIIAYLRNYFRAFKLERYNEPEFIQLYLKSTADTTPMTTILADLAYNDFDRILPRQAYGRLGYSSDKYWSSLLNYELAAGTISKIPPLNTVYTESLIQTANQGTCGAFNTVRVAVDGSIPRTTNAELWVGQDQGFFGQESVNLEIVKASSSSAALADVAAGKADMALIAGKSLPPKTQNLVSVYQSTYGSDNDVFVAPQKSLSNDTLKGSIVRMLQGYTYARQFCSDNPRACAMSYSKRSGDTTAISKLMSTIKARAVSVGRHLTGWNTLHGAVTNQLLNVVNKQQCFWTASRPD